MKIVEYPNYCLRAENEPIAKVDRHLLRLLTNLERTLKNESIGVGLAAPQIEINRQVIAVNLPDANGKAFQYNHFINPRVLKQSEKLTLSSSSKKKDLEGCLSVPHIYAPVWRPEWIELAYQQVENEQLVKKTAKFSDFAARVVLHEVDHLQGVLFVDHVLTQNTPLYLENNQGELEEITKEDLFEIFGPF